MRTNEIVIVDAILYEEMITLLSVSDQQNMSADLITEIEKHKNNFPD